jgi:CheY-like chemotaxis protein
MDTPQHPNVTAETASGRTRVLVVDDDPALRLLLRATLAADEFELQEVASAEEAGDTARFWRPSVVLLDVTLPGMNGLAFCRQLTRTQAYGNPKVLLLTGAKLTADEAKAAVERAPAQAVQPTRAHPPHRRGRRRDERAGRRFRHEHRAAARLCTRPQPHHRG